MANCAKYLPFLKEHHLQSVLIVSQYFHIARCRLAFSKFGIEPLYTSHAPFWSLRDFFSVPREVIGYGVYYLRQTLAEKSQEFAEKGNDVYVAP